jgi:hypothetical protein
MVKHVVRWIKVVIHIICHIDFHNGYKGHPLSLFENVSGGKNMLNKRI